MNAFDPRAEALRLLARDRRKSIALEHPGRLVVLTAPAIGDPWGVVYAIRPPWPESWSSFSVYLDESPARPDLVTYHRVCLDARQLYMRGGATLWAYAHGDADFNGLVGMLEAWDRA